MKFWIVPATWAWLVLLVACQPPVTDNRMEQMAKDCCECTSALLELNQRAAQAPAEADFKALEAEYQRTRTCLATVTSNFGKLKTEELTALKIHLQPKCPNLAGQHELLREMLGE